MLDFLLGAIVGGMPKRVFAIFFAFLMLAAALAVLFMWVVTR